MFVDEWVQEWQGPRTRAILEPTNRLLLTPPPACHLLGPPSTMLLLFKTGQTVLVLAASILVLKQPPERFGHCCVGWHHHGNCLGGSAPLGLVQIEPVLLAKVGLGISAVAVLPGAPIIAMSMTHLTSYLVSPASQHGCFLTDVRLNFLSCCLYLISDSPCFFKSQLLKILCLNICQGLGISWIGTGCQDIIFSLILYTVIILILKQLSTSYNHFRRLVVAANSKNYFIWI